MNIKRLKSKGYFVSVLNKIKIFSIGLHYYFFNLFVNLYGKLNVVKHGEIFKQANVSAVYGRRIKNVKRKEVGVFALSQANTSARRKIFDLNTSVINEVKSFHDISLENVVTRLVIRLEYGMRKVNHVTLFNKSGIFCLFRLKRRVLMTAEVTVCTVEIGFVNIGKYFPIGFYLVGAGIGKERCYVILMVTLYEIFILS